jgi:NAD(P)-dependent dehydrogenase (short-subunit alcohol dehydrogenase family)
LQVIKQGQGGRIINMASQAKRRGKALVAVYCATKLAVISLTQSAGLNLIKYGINVNAIAPGWWRASTGTASTRCSQNTRIARSARRSASSARRSRSAAGAPQKIWSGWHLELRHNAGVLYEPAI